MSVCVSTLALIAMASQGTRVLRTRGCFLTTGAGLNNYWSKLVKNYCVNGQGIVTQRVLVQEAWLKDLLICEALVRPLQAVAVISQGVHLVNN
jgi:hypothetical protein